MISTVNKNQIPKPIGSKTWGYQKNVQIQLCLVVLKLPNPVVKILWVTHPKKKTTTQFEGVETPKIRGSNFGFQTDSQIKTNLVLLIPEAQTN